MAKATAPKKDALSKYDAKLAEIASRGKKAESKVGGEANFISLRGGHMQYQGAVIKNDTLRAVVMCSLNENQYYIGRYDPESPSAPICYAFARAEELDTMAPNPAEVTKPQAESCAECPNNVWGSADVGRGKACKEVRRIALITEDGAKNPAEAEVAFLKASVTNLKHWAGYVRQCADIHHKPPFAFLTEIKIVTDPPGTQPGWHLEFNIVEEVDPSTIGALIELSEKIEKTIAFPYPKFEEQPAKGRRATPPAGGKKRKF